MWIRHSNGVVVLVHNEAHIKRLLAEGGEEVADPNAAQQELEPAPETPEQQESEQADGSTSVNEPSNSGSPQDDRRPSKRKPAVRRSRHSG